MKALSIKQPWVWMILHGGKNVENRSWKTKYRGWIALHASAKPLPAAADHFPGRVRCPDLKQLDYSAICGVARLVDVTSTSRSKWFYRPDDARTNFGWILEDVMALPRPIQCKGSLGLWTVPPTVLRGIRRQLPDVDLRGGTS